MKRALALTMLASCTGTARPSPPKAAEAPPPLPALEVKRVIHVDDREGFLAADSSFAVVLTRAVDPAPDALALLDQAGAAIRGTTVWLDRQLLIFYPEKELGRGLELTLRITAPLRTKDGAILSPREIARTSTPPFKLLSSKVVGGDLSPMGGVTLSFEQKLPAAEVGALGSLTVDGTPLGFTASNEPHRVLIRADTGFPPGREAHFGWKEGPVASTSVGRVALEPVTARAKKGFFVHVGESGDNCSWESPEHYRCRANLVHIDFAAPIPDAELAVHIHPPLGRATGDTRGHRFEVSLLKKKVAIIVLDGALTDSFGQTRGGTNPTKLEIRHVE